MKIDFKIEFGGNSMKKRDIEKRIKLIDRSISKGQVKLSKKAMINLKKCVYDSVSNNICGYLDSVISRQDVVIDTDNKNTDIILLCKQMMQIADSSDIDTPLTLVIPLSKKTAKESFNYLDTGIMGDLLLRSTLGPVYKKVAQEWNQCNNKTDSLSSILYLPDICIFIDKYSGEYQKYYKKINLLFVSLPSKKILERNNNNIVMEDETYYSALIADLLDSVIKCGCKNVVIPPFFGKMKKDPYTAGMLWDVITSSQKTRVHIDKIIFSLDGEPELMALGKFFFKK